MVGPVGSKGIVGFWGLKSRIERPPLPRMNCSCANWGTRVRANAADASWGHPISCQLVALKLDYGLHSVFVLLCASIGLFEVQRPLQVPPLCAVCRA